MAECPKLNSFDANPDIITKDNVAQLRLSTYNRSHGTEVKLSCEEDYKLVGLELVKCLTNSKWDFDTKPYCTVNPVDDGLSEETRILIGVLAGIAGLVILVLLFIVCVVSARMKEKASEDKLYVLETSEEIPVKDNPGCWREDINYRPPNFTRSLSPSVYSIHHHQREYPYRQPSTENRYMNTYEESTSLPPKKDRRSKVLNSEKTYKWYDHRGTGPLFQNDQNTTNDKPNPPPKRNRSDRTVSSEPPGDTTYVGNWPTRGSIKEMNEFNRRALLHGRDPFLWKNVDTNWGIHLPKKDYEDLDAMF